MDRSKEDEQIGQQNGRSGSSVSNALSPPELVWENEGGHLRVGLDEQNGSFHSAQSAATGDHL